MPEQRTIRALVKELVDTPFFPLLFIAEFVKQVVQTGSFALEHGLVALGCTIIWIFSDAISVEYDAVVGEDTDGSD